MLIDPIGRISILNGLSLDLVPVIENTVMLYTSTENQSQRTDNVWDGDSDLGKLPPAL